MGIGAVVHIKSIYKLQTENIRYYFSSVHFNSIVSVKEKKKLIEHSLKCKR